MKKVAIVGGAPSSQMLAPFDDMSWEIWVLGNQLSDYDGKAITLVFEIHDDLSDKPDAYPDWVVKHSPKMIVGEKFPIKNDKIEVFPFDEAKTLLDGEYLSSSMAYMMAYAILQGATDIGVYGVDMGVDDHEYFKQRPDMYAWIGYAKGRGINIEIPSKAPIFKSNYCEGRDWRTTGSDLGIKPFTQKGFNELAKQHSEARDRLKKEIDVLVERRIAHMGAVTTYENLARVSRMIDAGGEIMDLEDFLRIKQ